MSETGNEIYEVTDGKIVIQADAIRPGSNYRPIDNGDGTFYLAQSPRQEDDGSRNVLLLEDGYNALQVFCNDMSGLAGHRLEYTLTLSGLAAWSLEEERWEALEKRVLDYGRAIYSGEKKGRPGSAKFMRIPGDVITRMNQFASHMAETTGGMNPERTVILTALTNWAVNEEEVLDAVDDYALQLITKRREERRRARAQPEDSKSGDAEHETHLIESNGAPVTQEPEVDDRDHFTVTKGTRRTATSAS